MTKEQIVTLINHRIDLFSLVKQRGVPKEEMGYVSAKLTELNYLKSVIDAGGEENLCNQDTEKFTNGKISIRR